MQPYTTMTVATATDCTSASEDMKATVISEIEDLTLEEKRYLLELIKQSRCVQ